MFARKIMSGLPTEAAILETNFVRLLCCTEDLVASGQTNGWRFSSYLSTLHSFLNELSSSECSPSRDYIRHYESRVSLFLLVSFRETAFLLYVLISNSIRVTLLLCNVSLWSYIASQSLTSVVFTSRCN